MWTLKLDYIGRRSGILFQMRQSILFQKSDTRIVQFVGKAKRESKEEASQASEVWTCLKKVVIKE